MIELRLPNGDVRRVEPGVTAAEVAADIGAGLAKAAVAARVDGNLVDLGFPLKESCDFEIITGSSAAGLEVIRHSTAHLMAQAVQNLFDGVQVTIGPVIENGFFYDFAADTPFSSEDLEKIEAEMRRLAKEDLQVTRSELPTAEAVKKFADMGEQYKVEIIEDLGEETVSLYSQGEWVDLCRGPHVPSTGKLGHFKLTSVAGAYWRGDERNAMLQRIYGTAWSNKKELKQHLERLEEAKRRDHRKLGKELGLFSIREEIGPGLVLWHPKGARIRSLIEDFWRRKHFEADYELLYSPHIANLDLWRTSGHLDFYGENMFGRMEVDERELQLKPMNCPFHISVYRADMRSYRDLPLRWAELGTVYRYERSGVLHGLMRVRGFTQDDAHIFCTPEQLESEIMEVLDLVLDILGTFGFTEYSIYLSTQPEKFVGEQQHWDDATAALAGALKKREIEYEVDPGEGVFYGPKIDIKIHDSIGRAWQCSTIQVDFNLPERFGITYIGSDGEEHRPIMVHRALMGSLERFFGILIEHYAGAFPTWLAPIQARILTVSDKADEAAGEAAARLKKLGVRVESDLRNEKLGKKVAEAQVEKIPYMLIIGEKEAQEACVNVRLRTGETLGVKTPEEVSELIAKDCESQGR